MRNTRSKRNHKLKKYLPLTAIAVLVFASAALFKLISQGSSNNTLLATNTTNPTASPVATATPQSKTVLLSFAGDSTLGTDSTWASAGTLPAVLIANNNNYSYFFKNVYSIFSKDDQTIVNLETTFTNSTDKALKGPIAQAGKTWYSFKGSPDYAKILTSGSVEAVNLANNHMLDYKQKGLTDTIAALKSQNVGYFGQGNKYIKTINGVKFGFLGYTGYSYSSSTLKTIKADIASLKSQNCIVVVTFHWGIERSYQPNSTQTYLAKYSIDNGADLIIGHHPHVIQPVRTYKGKTIVYSLGNFCFGGNKNPSDKDTFIFQAKFTVTGSKATYTSSVIPCSISSVSNKNNYCPTPVTEAVKKASILKKIYN